MMSSLILLSIVLTFFVGVLCAQLYLMQKETLKKLDLQQKLLTKIDTAFVDLLSTNGNVTKRIEQLASDVLQREIYQNADDRHQLAIQSAKQGKGFFELMQCHGLSSDEAALIVSLHSPQKSNDISNIKNANLIDPSILDVV